MLPCSIESRGTGVAACLASVLLTISGCTGSAAPRAEVQGKVTLNGTPLIGAVVTFYPMTEGPTGLPSSRGTTDQTGTYQLKGADGSPGALVGKCMVVVNWPPRDRSDTKPPLKRGPPIPLKYTVATETPLIFEVKAGAVNTIDLVLTD